MQSRKAPVAPVVSISGAISSGPISREPWMVAALSAMALSSRSRGTRLGTSDPVAGIITARAEPSTSASTTTYHTSMVPATARPTSTTLCARLSPNEPASTVLRSNRSASSPAKGEMKKRGNIAAKVTTPTMREDCPMS